MMGKTQKVFTVGLWALLVIAMVGIVATRATRSQPEHDAAAAQQQRSLVPAEPRFAPLYAAPAFQLTDQNANPFGSNDLRGKVWIADFIFTHCAGACQIMTGHLQDVQRQVASPDVKLVSFSVDPKRDTPEVLKEYAHRFGADDARWRFLTGTEKQISDVAVGMKVAARIDPDGGVTHSEYFLLVDRDGRICGIYHKDDEQEMKRLPIDAEELASRPAGQSR